MLHDGLEGKVPVISQYEKQHTEGRVYRILKETLEEVLDDLYTRPKKAEAIMQPRLKDPVTLFCALRKNHPEILDLKIARAKGALETEERMGAIYGGYNARDCHWYL